MKLPFHPIPKPGNPTNRSRKGAAQLKPLGDGGMRMLFDTNRSRKGAAQLKPRAARRFRLAVPV